VPLLGRNSRPLGFDLKSDRKVGHWRVSIRRGGSPVFIEITLSHVTMQRLRRPQRGRRPVMTVAALGEPVGHRV
jgi:hypothetical protein